MEREGSRAEDGEKYDIFPPVAVAEEAAQQRADGQRGKEGEQAELRFLYRDAEFLDEEEREVTGHARDEEVFRENHDN